MKGLFAAISRGIEEKSYALDYASNPTLRNFIGYPESRSGVAVNSNRALQVAAVFACVRVIANGVAQVPLKVLRPSADGKGSVTATDHPLWSILYRRPNAWQTSFQFRQTLVMHRALAGNFYAFKNMVGGEIYGLVPLEPDKVEVIRNGDMSLTYRLSGSDGSQREVPANLIWHVRGPSWNSWMGLDAVRYAREAIGLAIVTEQSQADMHRNGMQTTGLFSVDATLDDDQYKQLRAWIDLQVAGQASGDKRFGTFLLDNKASFTKMAMSGVDAQHLETRKMQIEEICRAFGVFPQMIGHSGDQAPTFASAEQFFNAHQIHTLAPWYEDLQQSMDNELIDEGDDAFVKFVPNALMSASATDQSNYFSKALGAGGSPAWHTQNEVRALLDLNPLPGGDELPKPTKPPNTPPPT